MNPRKIAKDMLDDALAETAVNLTHPQRQVILALLTTLLNAMISLLENSITCMHHNNGEPRKPPPHPC
jgi:hypothetical protein